MKKVIKLSESDLIGLVNKILNEQQPEYVLPLNSRLKFAREKYVKFLESSLRMVKPNDANENTGNIDEVLVNILNETGKLLEMVRSSELEKQKNPSPPIFKNPAVKK